MKRILVWIGLDYHFGRIQMRVLDRAGWSVLNASCGNDWRMVAARVRPEWDGKGVAIEACSGAADLAEELIGNLDWPVILTHPGTAARMKRNPDQSDYTDARVLGDLVRVGYAERVWLPPAEVRDLRLVTRYREQLVRERRDVKLRIGAILREQREMALPARRWSTPWLGAIKSSAEISAQGRWVIQRHLERLSELAQAIAQAERHMAEITREDALVKKLLAYKGGISDGLRAAGGTGQDRAIRFREEARALLRLESAQRIQRKQAGRRRTDPRGQSRPAHGDHRNRPSPGPSRTALEAAASRAVSPPPRWPTAGCAACFMI